MPKITLPDGSEKEFAGPVSGAEIAASIGPGLAEAALAMAVDGVQEDLSTTLTTDATVRFLTARDEDGLDILRHTLAAQVLARAVKDLYPSAKLAIGPTVEHGFYYDVAFENPLSSEDLARIEARMREIVAEDLPITREVWSRNKAIDYFETRGEEYKVQIIRDTPESETEFSLYRQGKDGDSTFVDLCYGPHLPRVGKAGKAFRLTTLAGAYWRGDSNNEMLTRIYGTAWATDKDLKNHLRMLEEAAKRDHRRLGKELDLFHFEDSAPGQPFWHPKGWALYNRLMDYMRRKVQDHGYVEVNTPQVLDVNFWKYSGHWDKYRENMFIVDEAREHPMALKPMSCPGNVQIYKQGVKSYRDLPIRMAEFGKVFRHEAHGARHGLMRVQGFTQDDAHIFCSPEQLEDEVVAMCDLIHEVYTELGFSDVLVRFADRPEQRIGSDEDWDKAEAVLRRVCERMGFNWVYNPGDGAFYAPKLDFVLRDAIGRDWQCGTIQVDMNLPTRLDMTYIGEDGERHRPRMVHRAILGSVERFMGVLIEHHAGHFPLWLAPTQIVVTGITEKQNEAVNQLTDQLHNEGFRVEADLRNEKISYKVREHSLQKIPVMLVLGEREVENGTATIRRFGSKAQTTLPVPELINRLRQEVSEKRASFAPTAEAA
jgi:threonyl-tRNA synthetase